MVTPATERKAVVHLRDAFGMSERRACKAIGCCRMTVRYRTTRADDAGLRQRMREVAQERRRFGYRRLQVSSVPPAYCDRAQAGGYWQWRFPASEIVRKVMVAGAKITAPGPAGMPVRFGS